MSRRSALAAALTVSALAFAGASSARATTTTASSSGQSTSSDAPIPVAPSNTPPTGRRLSPNQVLAIAERLPKMRAVRRKHPGSYGGAYLKLPLHWQVSFFSRNGRKEIGQVIIDDQTARVLEQWTGFQVAWTMARGYPGAFGRHVNALYIWLPLCVLFMLPFFNFRRPLTLLHLDLLVLLSFSVSLAFFNHAEIYKSVPLVYPPLLYLLARMLALARVRWRAVLPGTGSARSRARTHARAAPPRLHLLVPTPWLALGVVFLIGFRVALNVTDSNVIDVGYAGVIGAQRIVDGKPLYGHYPSDNEHGDTYGPVAYESYVPFEQVFGWSGKWDDLPAAHAAAIFFDLLAIALLFLIGRRVRGPSLGIALAYGWAAFPFTLYSLESNSNDTLVAVFVLAALLAATYRGRLAGPARGAFTALAGLTKFAPLAIAPVLATAGSQASDGQGSDGQASDGQASGGEASAGGTQTALRARARARARDPLTFLMAFIAIAAIASIPALTHDSLHTIYERTLAYQANRGSPFSVWGLYGGIGGLENVVRIAAILLALVLALLPRRTDVASLAAACGAVIIATQLGLDHWFYLYIPWFFPLVLVALFAQPAAAGLRPAPAVASESARSSPPAVVVSSG